MSEFGSLDIQFTLPTFDTGEWVGIKTDIHLDGDDTHIVARVYSNAIWLVSEPSGDIIDKISASVILPTLDALFADTFLPLFTVNPEYTSTPGIAFSNGETIRILFENDSVTLFRNENYYRTFYLPSVVYPNDDDPVSYLICSSGWAAFPTLEILLSELSDWRESIYIETNAVAMSGVTDLIQERPVMTLARADGSVDFFYDQSPTSYDIHDNIIRSHAEDEIDSPSATEAMIEGRELTALSLPEYAEEFGYQFAIVHLNSLDSGEKKAARVLMRHAAENAVQHSLELRPDLRIQPEDAVSISPAVAGPGTILDHDIIVRELYLSISNSEASMNVEGRRKL